uniref:RNA-directed DNA polymerase n=1 Tax=Trichuris muris TaxID=70415 RepID=A0A5S6Q6B7_TRIMR
MSTLTIWHKSSGGSKKQVSKLTSTCEEVRFRGHVISEKGIEPDPSLTDKVRSYPVPNCFAEVQSFLGLASSYRKFVKNLAAIAKPLHQLTEKRKPFEWTPECTSAFQKLRMAVLSEPTLRLPDFDAPFILDTDANDTAIGAVLSQRDEHGHEHPVAYASPRWQQKLQQYDFVIEHRTCSKHANADTLSRIPCKQCGRHNAEEASQLVSAVLFDDSEEIRRVQWEDSDIAPILKDKEAGVTKEWTNRGRQSNANRLLMLNWHRLAIQNGILVRKWFCDDQSGYRWQVVVSKRMINSVLEQAHEELTAGHLGMEKTIERIRERFY